MSRTNYEPSGDDMLWSWIGLGVVLLMVLAWGPTIVPKRRARGVVAGTITAAEHGIGGGNDHHR
ncbi:hypothetical protein V5P93_000131 [Actinokineospora auranticolor]|nr:hypothetical protein [Actinokineospora auranticolor]